jgi:hypothetical protein
LEHLAPAALFSTLCTVLGAVSSHDTSSPFRRPVPERSVPDLQDDFFAAAAALLTVLNFPDTPDLPGLLKSLNRPALLHAFYFLLSDWDRNCRRAYLSLYLAPPDVPLEYSLDDVIAELTGQIERLQSEFKEVHRAVDQSRAAGSAAATLKQDISQLDEGEFFHLFIV